MSEARLSDLEVKCAYLERTVAELSEVMWRQQKELDAIKEIQRQMRDRVNADPGIVDASRNDRPPHY